MSFRPLLLICAALLRSACHFRGQNAAAEERVSLFHQLYDREEFERLSGLTAPEFQQATSPAAFASLMKSLREQLGEVERSERRDWTVNYFPEARLTLTYVTEFDRGTAMETFTFDYDEPPRLINYNASVSAVRPR